MCCCKVFEWYGLSVGTFDVKFATIYYDIYTYIYIYIYIYIFEILFYLSYDGKGEGRIVVLVTRRLVELLYKGLFDVAFF